VDPRRELGGRRRRRGLQASRRLVDTPDREEHLEQAAAGEEGVHRVGAGIVGYLAKQADRVLRPGRSREPRFSHEHPRLGAHTAWRKCVGLAGEHLESGRVDAERGAAAHPLETRERLEAAFRPSRHPRDTLPRAPRPGAVRGAGDALPLSSERVLELAIFLVGDADPKVRLRHVHRVAAFDADVGLRGRRRRPQRSGKGVSTECAQDRPGRQHPARATGESR
jgi:hypothetical protein